jgi:carbonyl reductase 1
MNPASPYAVVTGSNRGIGLEIVRQLLAAGVRVLATSRDPAKGQSAAERLGAEYFMLDVTSDASVNALAHHLAGGFDILVNNAGVSLQGFDAEVARKTLDVNFYGAMRTTDRLLPAMRRDGRIVMVSSGMGELSAVSPELRERFEDPRLTRAALSELGDSFVRDVAAGTHSQRGWPSSAYRVSKIALNAFTRLLARELAPDPRRILVNAACPGWVRTDMGGSSAPRSATKGAETPVWLALLPEDGPTGGFFRDQQPISW